MDVVIVGDIDRLTRNLTDWNAFEKACVRHGVRLSAYTGGTWICPRQKAPTTAGWRRSGRGGKARSRARGSGKPRTARRARAGGPAEGSAGSDTRASTPTRTSPTTKRHILCEEINPVEAEAIRDATILHPEVGPLALASEVLLDSTGEQSLVLYTAQPGTDTAEKLELLRVLGREKFAELREVR